VNADTTHEILHSVPRNRKANGAYNCPHASNKNTESNQINSFVSDLLRN